jgi:phage terminase large subunit-like protein
MNLPEGSYFDEAKASAAIATIESYKLHAGEFAGKNIQLLPWQRDLISTIFGTLDKDTDLRTYREVFCFIPARNGKTTLASAIALYFLNDESEPGGEIYAAAPSQMQSDQTYRYLLGMIEETGLNSKKKKLKENSQTKIIRNLNNATFFRSLSSDARYVHGLNASCVICDELHAFESRDLFDNLQSRTGSRRQPLFLTITTAGSSANSEHVCYQKYKYACNVRDGLVNDRRFLPVIFEAATTDDPFDEETWYKAQPSLGIVRKVEDMERKAAQAKASIRDRNRFLRDDLNLWVATDEAWLNPDEWIACFDANIDLEALKGRQCVLGLDLSVNTDLTALNVLFPMEDGTFVTLPYYWLPKDGLDQKEAKDKENYKLWNSEKMLNLTDGSIINQEDIRLFIHELNKLYDIQRIGVDPALAAKMAGDLSNDGYDVGYVKQTTWALSPALKDLEANIKAKKIRHSNHPILNWNVGNCVISEGTMKDIKLVKDKATGRIDGAIALAIANHVYLSLNSEGRAIGAAEGSNPLEGFYFG